MMLEMTPVSESVTAVMTSHLESGENFDGPITIGFYPQNSAEIFVKTQGVVINVQVGDVDALCKQLKRAKKLALEQQEPTP